MDLAFLEETKFCLPARRSCRKPSPAFPSPCPTLPALCRISAVNRRTPHQSQRGPLTGTGPAGWPVGSDAYSWGLSSSENTSSGATS